MCTQVKHHQSHVWALCARMCEARKPNIHKIKRRIRNRTNKRDFLFSHSLAPPTIMNACNSKTMNTVPSQPSKPEYTLLVLFSCHSVTLAMAYFLLCQKAFFSSWSSPAEQRTFLYLFGGVGILASSHHTRISNFEFGDLDSTLTLLWPWIWLCMSLRRGVDERKRMRKKKRCANTEPQEPHSEQNKNSV